MNRNKNSENGAEQSAIQNSGLPQEKLNFYEKFFQEEKLKKTSIEGSTIINETQGKPFTVYVIKVETDQLSYEIQKRYSQFQSLKMEVDGKVSRSILNEFPPKKYFGNQQPEHIEARRIALDGFLTNLVELQHESMLVELYEFLQIFNTFQVNKIQLSSSTMNRSQQSQMKSINQQSIINDSDMIEINDMLVLLNKNSDEQIQNYRQIEERYGKQKPKLSLKPVKLLLHVNSIIGKQQNLVAFSYYQKGNDMYKGLISVAGQQTNEDLQTKNNHMQCSAGLQLLTKLLDFEFNRDADIYIQVFAKETALQLYKELRLDKHILVTPANNCRQYAFMLLKKYADKNMDKQHADKNIDAMMMEYFELSKTSLEEYKKWIQQKQKDTTNQYIMRSQQQELLEEKDKSIMSESLSNINDQIDQLIHNKDWVTVKIDRTVFKIKTASCGSRLFKITAYFSTEKENLVDFFLQNLHIWDNRCLSYKELTVEDVNDQESLPIYSEQYESRSKQILYLYRFEQIRSEQNIKMCKRSIDKKLVKRNVLQNDDIADWMEYFLFKNYSNPKHPEVKCKVVQVIEHHNDHFFLSEMTGDKDDTIKSLIKLQNHVKSKYAHNKPTNVALKK